MNPKFRAFAVAALAAFALVPQAKGDVSRLCDSGHKYGLPEMRETESSLHVGPCSKSSRFGERLWFRDPAAGRMRPVSAFQEKTAAISAAVSDGNFGKISAGLDGLFIGDGSRGGASRSVPVAAGNWSAGPSAHMEFARFQDFARHETVVPAVERREAEGDDGARVVLVGVEGAVRDAIIGAVVNVIGSSAAGAVNNYVNRNQTQESINRYGGCRMRGACGR